MTTATETKKETLTFMEWLEKYYGFTGATLEEVEEKVLYANKRITDETFEDEDFPFSYSSAERDTMKMFQEEYIEDAEKYGFERGTKLFWWETPAS